MKAILALSIVLVVAPAASAEMVITEWMYSGSSGEFIEFTNVGTTAIDMTGWSFDDDSETPGTVDLSGYGLVDPGESVILTEVVADDFIAAWGLTNTDVIGENPANLGRSDAMNLYDASDNLVDQLIYGDEDYPGTPRTKDASCNIPASDFGVTIAQTSWELAVVGDVYGSWESADGDIASPGTALIPEPTTLALVLCGGLAIVRRRR